ncbi:MAG: exodeoxyribonuclease V subunit alpha, partial [Thermodesulfobacteriota bacterium]|nr:exodeoxyribonuclease V subunit alpha [Thermodesulfobacteriota bacterium]
MTIRDLRELGGYQDDNCIYAVLMAMFAVLQEGSLCLSLDKNSMVSRLKIFMEEDMAEKIANQFLTNLAGDKYSNLIAKDRSLYLPLVLYEFAEKKYLYFQKFYFHENRLKDRIKTILQAKSSLKLNEKQQINLLNEIMSETLSLRVSKNGVPLIKDPHQINAIKLALSSQFSIISGGPGTGKTSLMVNILRCLVRAHIDTERTGTEKIDTENILLAAPTGRAAQRMTETISGNISTIANPSPEDIRLLNLKGATLHKILQYKVYKNDFHYNDTNLLPASVIVVDEVSMIDVVMMDKFLQAVDPAKTKLIFLGDKDQLPSVEAGAVFAEMIPEQIDEFTDRVVLLRNVYRSGANLLQVAKQINQGKCPEYEPVSFDSALQLKEDQWAFVQSTSLNQWKHHLHSWVRDHYISRMQGDNISYKELIFESGKMDSDELLTSKAGQDILCRIFHVVGCGRILTILRNGIYGCTWINSIINQSLGFELEPASWTGENIFAGAVIIITHNDYSKELFNGDIGVVIKSKKGDYRAFFQRFDSFISFSIDLLPSWGPAFAMTVHKSQGSEFDDVLVVLPDNDSHRLLTREIIYTGIT